MCPFGLSCLLPAALSLPIHVIAKCQASGRPCEPDIEMSDRIPATVNDEATTDRVINVFTAFFGDRFVPVPPITASEDFGDIPDA